MSYDYRQTSQRRTNTYNRPGRRSLYAPPPPPPRGGSQHHHGLFTYWIPLVVTGTIAIGGLAAWVWSEREHSHHHEDDEYHSDGKPPRPQGPPQRPPGQQQPNMPQGPYQPSAPGALQGPSGPVAPPSSTGGGPPTVAPSVSAPGGEAASYYDQSQSYRGNQQTSESRDVSAQEQQQQGGGGWYDRVTGIFQRTPSPQQIMSGAGKLGTAAMAGLGSILEDGAEDSDHAYEERRTEQSSSGRSTTRRRRSDEERDRRQQLKEQDRLAREKEGFSDHERWSEEAEEQSNRISVVEAESERRADSAREKGKGRNGRSVAVVVNADVQDGGAVHDEDHEEEVGLGDASILSHLPPSTSAQSDLFILIHAPGLQGLPPTSWRPQGPSSPASTGAVNTPGSELQSMSPRPSSPTNGTFNPTPQFSALYSQALTLVSSPSQILPFTTPNGYVHILRHLSPQLVYISDSLAGREGESVARLKGWVGHSVLVAGDEGLGGLVDTETETEAEEEKGRRKGKSREGKWWERSDFVGLGKDVEVVDAGRVGEDWVRRVGGRE